MFVDYFHTHHKTEILQILRNEDVTKHYAINVNFLELFTADASVGNDLLRHPEGILKEFDASLQTVQYVLAEHQNSVTVKPNTHTRVYGVPICPELHKSLLPGNEDLGSFLQISGTVVRITLPKMLEFHRQYICAKCKYKINVNADLEQKYIIVPPKNCTNPESCKSTTLVLNDKLDVASSCKDYQEVKIQEQLSKLGMGKVPSSVWIVVEDDLVDICKPGDNVTVCGIVKRRWKPQYVDRELKVELFLKANHVQVNNDSGSINLVAPDIREQHENFWNKCGANPLEGRNIILKSICPEIYGLFIVKLALAVVLAGGSQLEKSEGTITPRSHPHLLLVGDPGTGKSQLLHFASKIIPRSVLTTGIGSTSAGLTVTAVMEDGEWQLEGGALVMADGGICCIDEFNSMKKQDRTSIHEAMEQQTISVAKAGVVCKLHTRCTILAATNPKCGIDSTQPFGMNINIASPLLSRFDVVLHLKDKIDKDWDGLVAEYVLNGESFQDCKENSSIWSIEMLQSYFLLIKQTHPVLTPHASQILSSYYQAQRVIASRNKARTTVRLLDSLIRLSQGHARLMFHQEVQVIDAIIAVTLMEASLQGDSTVLSLDFDLNSDFPENPAITQNYLNRIVLEKLDLLHLLEDTEETEGDNGFKANVKSFQSEFKFTSDRKMLSRSTHEDKSRETVIDVSNSSKQQQPSKSSFNDKQDASETNDITNRKSLKEKQKRTDHVSFATNSLIPDLKKRKRKKSDKLRESDDALENFVALDEPKKPDNRSYDLSPVKAQNDSRFLYANVNAESDTGSSTHKRKLEAFRFKPRVDVAETSTLESGLDLKQMLNMIPSVADDFDINDLDDVS